jgi:hypothetical protein
MNRRTYDLNIIHKNEDVLQAYCWQWLYDTHPETRKCCWHVPNGGARTKVQAAQFTGMGVVAGVHDLHFFWQKQFYIFELKVGNNTLTKAQEEWRDIMIAQGAIFNEIRDLKTFQNIIHGILQK